ncbi:unnamed protein product [Symbiodinium sp. CCMP2592]|nr:unnamed protein product [Symbiodinium sp. CCMP2592]
MDLGDGDIALRGITDIEDEYDHIAQIHSLIAAAKAKAKAKLKPKPKTLPKSAAKAKAKADPKAAPKREHFKNTDYWVINEDKNVLVRFHVKPRQYLMAFRYLRGTLPVDEKRLTGERETERHFKDGTSDVIVDKDFRVLDDDKVDNRVQLDPENIVSWRGRTVFKMKPLTGKALEEAKKVALRYQGPPTTALQTNRFRLSPPPPAEMVTLCQQRPPKSTNRAKANAWGTSQVPSANYQRTKSKVKVDDHQHP